MTNEIKKIIQKHFPCQHHAAQSCNCDIEHEQCYKEILDVVNTRATPTLVHAVSLEKCKDIALDGLILLINHCNDPLTIKPYGVPNTITEKLANAIKKLIDGQITGDCDFHQCQPARKEISVEDIFEVVFNARMNNEPYLKSNDLAISEAIKQYIDGKE